MRSLVITEWEFKSTLASKKFLLIFFLQISALVLMIMFFNQFLVNMETENSTFLSPSLTDFASLDVVDSNKFFVKYIEPDLLDVRSLNYNQSIKRLNNGEATAMLFVPSDSVNKLLEQEPITVDLFINYEDPKKSVITQQINSTVKLMSISFSNQWIDSLIGQNKTQEPAVKQEERGEPLPFQIIRKVMLAILLFFPLFLFGNMVVDSIVGEKERKTAEILIAMPLSHSQIIMGKSMAVVLTMGIQVAMWIFILMIAGFDIKNPLLVYMIIVLTSVPIIGITSIIAAYSKNYKEAGIGISFAYIGIVGFLVIPVLAYISRKSIISNISPMTLVMRLFTGEQIPLGEFLLPIFFILIISLISYGISIKLFKRDDIIFGPRPGIIRLIFEFIGIKRSGR